MNNKFFKMATSLAVVATTVLGSTVGSFAYDVQKGDTLSKIAKANGVTVQQLCDWNGITNPNMIKPGQVLKVSADGATPTKSTVISASTKAVLKKMFDAKYYAAQNPDVVKVLGSSEEALFNHFLKYGLNELRQPSASFNVNAYASAYSDVAKAYGDNIVGYYEHYAVFGQKEGRDVTTLEKAAAKGITVVKAGSKEVINTATAAAAAASSSEAVVTPVATSSIEQAVKNLLGKEITTVKYIIGKYNLTKVAAVKSANDEWLALEKDATTASKYIEFAEGSKEAALISAITSMTSSTAKTDLKMEYTAYVDMMDDINATLATFATEKNAILKNVKAEAYGDYSSYLTAKKNLEDSKPDHDKYIEEKAKYHTTYAENKEAFLEAKAKGYTIPTSLETSPKNKVKFGATYLIADSDELDSVLATERAKWAGGLDSTIFVQEDGTTPYKYNKVTTEPKTSDAQYKVTYVDTKQYDPMSVEDFKKTEPAAGISKLSGAPATVVADHEKVSVMSDAMKAAFEKDLAAGKTAGYLGGGISKIQVTVNAASVDTQYTAYTYSGKSVVITKYETGYVKIADGTYAASISGTEHYVGETKNAAVYYTGSEITGVEITSTKYIKAGKVDDTVVNKKTTGYVKGGKWYSDDPGSSTPVGDDPVYVDSSDNVVTEVTEVTSGYYTNDGNKTYSATKGDLHLSTDIKTPAVLYTADDATHIAVTSTAPQWGFGGKCYAVEADAKADMNTVAENNQHYSELIAEYTEALSGLEDAVKDNATTVAKHNNWVTNAAANEIKWKAYQADLKAYNEYETIKPLASWFTLAKFKTIAARDEQIAKDEAEFIKLNGKTPTTITDEADYTELIAKIDQQIYDLRESIVGTYAFAYFSNTQLPR